MARKMRKPSPRTRRFDGQTFKLRFHMKSKKSAQASANFVRDEGKKARLVKGWLFQRTTWLVYEGPKRKRRRRPPLSFEELGRRLFG